ncbi:hypothetical protein L596_029886 [Steinernema carpocapsae]|uniref:Major facilitator superfamily (MFS) profile domain-containing protein n=1 Tax=Steinernema carpocapsae TaxID=34508 RepID=A0A4U5LR51_STECR|nr:hypothetical protein L596_029886 [Steinernema carpocapsae]
MDFEVREEPVEPVQPSKWLIQAKKGVNMAKRAVLNITVEPIIFFVYFGWVFGNTLQSPGLYRRICETYYGDDHTVHCRHLNVHSVEDKVQAHSAEWALYCAICYLTPAIFADTILGAYGDRYGRQINILAGIAGIAFSEFGYMLTISEAAHTPYWTVLLFGLTAGSTGYIALVISCYAYLADITEDSSTLTIRNAFFNVAQSTASVFGGALAGLVSDISIPLGMDIELALFVIAFIYTLWRIPQASSIRDLKRQRGNTLTSIKSTKPSPMAFLKELGGLLKEGFVTYKRKRVGHRRAFMFVSAVVLMLTYTTYVETRTSLVIDTFVFRRTSHQALAWSAKDIGYWNAIGYLTLIVGTLGGVFIFKTVFKFRETTLILIALASSSVRLAVMAFSTKSWHMYLANVCGIFSGLIQPAVVTFMTQLVPNEEVGRAMSLFGIAADAAFIISNVVYSNIYRATVSWMPGFLFLFMSILQVLAGLAMLWVHFMSKTEGVGRIEQLLPRDPRDIQRAISTLGESTSEEGQRMSIFATSVKEKSKKAWKKKSTTMSIYEHAVERRLQKANSAGFWESLDDVRRDRKGSFY